MSEPQGLTLLITKYAELSGRLHALDKEARIIKASMTHLDASIRLINGDYDVGSILPKSPYVYNPYIKRGAYGGVALNILRESQGSLSAREICDIVIRRQGGEAPGKQVLNRMIRTMETCLMKKAVKGVISIDKTGFPKRFCIRMD